MTSRYRHRRTPNPGTAFPSPIEPGEIAVNTANRQLAVGDADNGSPGVPLTLIGVRVFDARASYAVGDFVVQGGSLYRAKSAVNPGAFNAAAWDLLSTDVLIKAYADAGDAAVTTAFQSADATIVTNYQAADTALTTSVNGKVAKAGDTMTGPLVLPVAAPTLDPQAANKKYVDDKIASIPTPSSLTVSDTPPVGVPDGALWWESDSGLLYVRYNDGNTTQWVIAAPQPDINAFALANTVVRYDTAQSLTAAQQQQARQNIYAAPFDAMAYSGLQINGGMEVSQELGATGIAAGGNGYVSDGWRVGQSSSSSGRMAAATASAVALGGFFPVGFRYLTHGYVTAAQASMGTNDLFMLTQYIEGWRIAKLGWGGGAANAQPITLGFWSAHARPGLYTGTIVNAAHTRSYAFSYTQIASAAAQYNVITIPGCPDDVWAYDNTIGMMLNFSMGCGTTYTAPAANSWQNGYYLAGPGQVNAIAATTDVFRITGVTILPGNEAPSAARSPFVMRPYAQELAQCQRYFQWVPYHMYFQAGAVSTGMQTAIPFQVTMRANPTMGAIAPDPNCAQAVSNNITNNFPTITPYGVSAQLVSGAAGPCYVAGYRAPADARL